MKVAHIVSSFFPRVGGMGEVCRGEVERLGEKGIESVVFTLKAPGSKKFDQIRGYKIFRLSACPRFGDAGWVPQLFFKLKNFDLVHLHYPFYGALEWVWLSKLIWGVPYVITYHMDASVSPGWGRLVQIPYDKIWSKRILQDARAIITVDEDHLGSTKFGSKLNSERVVEIHNAIDSEIANNSVISWEQCGLGDLDGKRVFLFVGNLLAFKRVDLILEALTHLPKNSALLVVGDGVERDFYRARARELRLGDRVLFFGRCLDRKKLTVIYSLSEALIVASDRAESFSLAALEALSVGTPVIASDIPGVRSRVTVGADGFLFKSGDSSDLARILQMFLNLPESDRHALGAYGQEKVKREYGWDKHLKKLLAVYNNSINL